MNRREAGFSLIELMVVVGIVGIMAGVTAMKIRNGPDDLAYRNAARAVISVARAASTAALANSTHSTYLLLDETTSSDRFVRAWVDLDDSGYTYSGSPTDLLIAEYHLCKGSYMNITKSSTIAATGGPATETWKFLPTGTATSATSYETILLSASKSKTDPANEYSSSSPTKWTTLTLTTATNRIRECYQAFGCP